MQFLEIFAIFFFVRKRKSTNLPVFSIFWTWSAYAFPLILSFSYGLHYGYGTCCIGLSPIAQNILVSKIFTKVWEAGPMLGSARRALCCYFRSTIHFPAPTVVSCRTLQTTFAMEKGGASAKEKGEALAQGNEEAIAMKNGEATAMENGGASAMKKGEVKPTQPSKK